MRTKFILDSKFLNTSGGNMKSKLEMNLTKLGKAGAQLLVLSFLVLSACTKSIPTQNADPIPDPVSAKSNLEGERLYSVSMQNASRTSSDALPYSSSDNKRVKLEVTQDKLRVVETERDARYASNKANDKLVLEIPIENFEIRCEKDKYGECTNKQVSATDIPWDQMKSVKIKFAESKSGDLDFLPILVSKTYGEDCYEEVSSRLVNSQIDADSMNWDIERTFKTKLECVTELDVISDATVSAVYHYSMVKVDKVLSKDFKVVSYPEGSDDERTFGFFSSKRTILDVDNNKTENTTVQVMNHWNPNRKTIDYYLSDEFAKPENKLIKDLTYETIANMNTGLQEAGVNFTIDLHDPAGKVPGDIRNSMIVLVEDPVASNVIGYGPQTEDPLTGEIISARTVMFLGTIKKFINSTYEEIIREKREDLAASKSTQKVVDPKAAIHLSKQLVANIASKKAMGKMAGLSEFSATIDKAVAAKQSLTKASLATGAKAKAGTAPVKAASFASNLNLKQMKSAIKNYTANTNPAIVGTDYLAKLKYLHEAKNCAFAPAAEGFGGGISDKLKAQFSASDKPWDQLTETEKNRVIAIILPEIWIPTLIHEMGHNLGLRHNFAGSEDKANFLSIEELQAKGIDHVVPFSSVMDYGNDLKTLPVLGKYDKAALRYGYLRSVVVETSTAATEKEPAKVVKSEEIQIQDGETLESTMASVPKVSGNLTTALKDYQYCTDENLGINAGCKQFDLGTSYTEIVQNAIADYEKAYFQRNFRNGRANMSLMDDLKYASRIGDIFEDLRIMMEVRERIKNKFHLLDDNEAWTSVGFLQDLNQASILSGVFLAKVLMVPDQTCAIASVKTPTEITVVAPLDSFAPDAMSCFDDVTGQFLADRDLIAVGEAGKAINSKKSLTNRNAYVDQIDKRGVWPDKLMAAKYLFNRQIGIYTMDDAVDNFLNIDVIRQPIADVAKAIMTNNVLDTVEFTLRDGSKTSFDLNYDLFDSQVIKQPMRDVIAKRMGLRTDGVTQLQEVLGRKIATGMNDVTGAHDQDKAMSLSMVVKRYAPESAINTAAVKTFAKDDTLFVANSSNTVAAEAMDTIVIVKQIEKLTQEKIMEIVKAKMAKQPMPATATDDEKVVWAMADETLVSYMNGTFKSVSFYSRLLDILPTSN